MSLLLSLAGLLRSPRSTPARRDAGLSVALGLVLLCAQLVLWWILYKVPEWSRQVGNF